MGVAPVFIGLLIRHYAYSVFVLRSTVMQSEQNVWSRQSIIGLSLDFDTHSWITYFLFVLVNVQAGIQEKITCVVKLVSLLTPFVCLFGLFKTITLSYIFFFQWRITCHLITVKSFYSQSYCRGHHIVTYSP